MKDNNTLKKMTPSMSETTVTTVDSSIQIGKYVFRLRLNETNCKQKFYMKKNFFLDNLPKILRRVRQCFLMGI